MNNTNKPTLDEKKLIYLQSECTKADEGILRFTNNYMDDDGVVYAEPVELHENNENIEYCLN